MSLLDASYCGDAETVEILLANDADVNATSDIGTTPLMNAAAHGHSEIVKILKQAGAVDERGLKQVFI